MAENKNRFPGFIGPSYTSRSQRFDCQRLVNYYLELNELGEGKGGEPAVAISTPGLDLLQSVGTGPIRCTYTQSNDEISYVVSGSEVYQITGSLGLPILVAGNLTTETGTVQAVDNGISVMFVDGVNGYYLNIGTPVLNTIVDPNFFPTDTITFQDGYFIGVQKGTNAFFISDINSVDFPPLNEAFAAGSPDILVAAISNNRQLYLLGTKSQEIWWNSGQSAATPFTRQDGRFSQVGCVSAASIAVLGETFLWLGTNNQGGGVVYMLDNAMPTRVSTYAVEFSLQSIGDLTGATAYAYQQEGHYFYVLNIPGLNTTWVYDMGTKQWAERQSSINGVTGRNIGETHCFLNGVHIIGDHSSGNIYSLNLNSYTENGNPIYRIRQSPHVSDSLNRMFYKLFEVDFQFGVGLPNNGSNPVSSVNPRVTLEISNDGGETWGNAIYAALGKIGQYKYRARWQRLGSSRDRVFRVTVTEPVRVVMLSAMLDVEVGVA